MAEICNDNRFKIIERAKEYILKYTNIETSKDEMKVLDNFLFRCWQMGWLRKFENTKIEKYLYPKNGHIYLYKGIIRSKDRTTGEWYDAILYENYLPKADGQLFVRDKQDFMNKFIKLEE